MVTPRDSLIEYVRVQTAEDRRVLALLRQATRDINRQLASLLGDATGVVIRRDQLLFARAALLERVLTLNSAVGATVKEGKIRAAIAADRAGLDQDAYLMRNNLTPERRAYLKKSAVTSSQEAVSLAERRLFGRGYIPLSEQVYKTGTVATGMVDSLVNSAISRGLSAREFAAEAASLVNPATPGGVSYASMRLARTELNNAFHARAIDAAREKPWVDVMQWTLSGSHPKPDACNDYADDTHFKGGDKGQYKVNDVPEKPHPHCLCVITEVAQSEDAFLDSLLNGDYDQYIDETVEKRRNGDNSTAFATASSTTTTTPPRPDGKRTR